jgi:hypothetical protein
MEINTDRDSKHDTEQGYFNPESPVYSRIEDVMEGHIS